MNESQGPAGPIDETSHSTTVAAARGTFVSLSRSQPYNFLTIREKNGLTLTALIDDDALRALLVSREQCCRNCRHARMDRLGVTRCHQQQRRGGGQLYAPKIPEPKTHVCGKFEPLVKPAARQVAA